MKTETKNAKHTPGPWAFNPSGPTTGAAIMGPDGELIGSAFGRPISKSQANARLMASAPELLEACKMSLRFLEAAYPLIKDRSDFEAPLKSVIAKAQGEV